MKEHLRNAIKTSLPKSRGTQAITPKRFLQRSASREGQSAKRPKSVYEVLQSPGQPLERTTRTWMEQRFGHDFSRVRVHTDKRAADSAREMNANAYTVGSNIVFAEGQYRPEQQSGKELLAHELTLPEINLNTYDFQSLLDASISYSRCNILAMASIP